MSTLVWQADDEVSRCFLCDSSYTFFNRRHHCRKCGRVVCGSCSDQAIQYFPGTLVANADGSSSRLRSWERYRTCDECADTTLMIQRALAETAESSPAPESSDDNNSTTKVATSTSTRMVPSSTNSSRLHLPRRDDASDHNLCPVCATNLAREFRVAVETDHEDQSYELFKERHINDCLVAFDFNLEHQRLASPRSGRHRNKMLVYNMPPIPRPQYESIPGTLEGTSADTVRLSPARVGGSERAREGEFGLESKKDSADLLGPSSEVYGSVNTILTLEPSEKTELDRECVICLEDLKPGDKVSRLECLCVFHYRCIKDWFNKKGYGECPVHYAPTM